MAEKDFIFCGWVYGPLYGWGRVIGAYLTVWGAGKYFIFSGWVSGSLCRCVKVIGGNFGHLRSWEGLCL